VFAPQLRLHALPYVALQAGSSSRCHRAAVCALQPYQQAAGGTFQLAGKTGHSSNEAGGWQCSAGHSSSGVEWDMPVWRVALFSLQGIRDTSALKQVGDVAACGKGGTRQQ
jgi:hypothetical protein